MQGSRVSLHGPRISIQGPRVSLQGSRVILHGSKTNLFGSNINLHKSRVHHASRVCVHDRLWVNIQGSKESLHSSSEPPWPQVSLHGLRVSLDFIGTGI
jgi:hypothetical protein